MASLKVTADNAAIISSQLAEITDKVNTGNGTLWKLIRDSTMASNISQTIVSLKKSSKGLDENMDAAKHNFLLRGFFKDKEKAAQKVKTDSLDKIAKEQKATQKAKDDSDKKKAAEQKVIEKKEKSDQKEKLKEEKKAEEQKPIDKGVK